MPKRILILGDEVLARPRFEGLTDVEFVVNDTQQPEPGSYDVVCLSNLVQQARRLQVPAILQVYRDALKEGGTLIVTAPSLEWACTELAVNEDASLFAYISLFGDDETPHLSGFRLLWLRGMIERMGMLVQNAHAEAYHVTVGEDTHRVLQNVVVAVKRTPQASEAIP